MQTASAQPGKQSRTAAAASALLSGAAGEPDLFPDHPAPDPDDFELPNWREVNRAERAARAADKLSASQRRSGEGTFRNVIVGVCRAAPGNPLKQVSDFLAEVDIPAATGRRRRIGDETSTKYSEVLHQSVVDLRAARMPIQNITDFGLKHMLTLVRYWMEKGNAIGTVKWRVSIWRRFLTLTAKAGKPPVIPKGRAWDQILRDHGLAAATVSRATIPDLSKGWRDLGLEPEPIIDAIRAEEPVVGACLDMMLAFGLRVNESVQIEPSDADEGMQLSVYRGTKGRKPRKVKFSGNAERQEWQRRLLQNAKLLASKHPKRRLAIPGLKLKQMKDRLRYLVKKHGATKGQLGITPHGLRHQFGTDLFRDLTGMPAPVLGLLPADEYNRNIDVVREAYLDVSRQMGHERPSISSAYISSPSHIGKLEQKRLKDWLTQLGDGAGSAFQAAGAQEAWIVGACAEGLLLRESGVMQLAVRFKTLDNEMGARLGELRKAAEHATSAKVNVTCWVEAHRPDDGAEILF